MTDETEGAQVAPKSKRGGYRPGSGRPKNSKNLRTIQKELKLKREVEAALAVASSAEIDQMSAVQIMDIAMKTFMKAGNILSAVVVARDLAPYQSSKVATMQPDFVLPEDMRPDPISIGDEPDLPPAIEAGPDNDERMAEYYRARIERRRELEVGGVAPGAPSLIE